MNRGRWLAAVAGALSVAIIVTLVIVIGGAESPPSAHQALDAAQRFVADAESVAYSGTNERRFEDDESFVDVEELGFDPFAPSAFDVEVVFPDRAHSVIRTGPIVSETVMIDDVSYSRAAEDRDGLVEESWARFDPSDDELIGDFSAARVAGFGVGFGSPLDLPDLIENARRPRVMRQDRNLTVLRIDADLTDASDFYFEDPFIALVVRDNGRIDELHLRGKDEFEAQAIRIEFERWSDDVDIVEPPDDDIDPTPNLDEEDLAELNGRTALFQPRVIPEGWVLESAGILPIPIAKTDCQRASLYLLEPEDEEFGYLSLDQFPEECSEQRPSDAVDFTAGPYVGWIEDEEGYLYGEITVGETVVEFDTDLDEEDVALLLADLVPLDLANPPLPSFVLVDDR